MSAAGYDPPHAAREAIAELRRSTERDRERFGRIPTWGDARFQQLLRDGGGGEAARRLQAEVDAGRTDWDALRRDDDPRHAGLQREWGEGAAAAVSRGYEEARAADEDATGASGTDDVGGSAAEVLAAQEREAAEWLRRRYEGEGGGAGSR